MATREFDVKRSAVELLNDWLAPWRARWNERKRARVDVSDEKRLAREQSKRLKLSERLEARLRSNLRSELRKNERLVIDCLTRLGFNNIVVKEKKRTVSKFKFAQTSASPTAFYLRVDTVKRPWGRQNNVLELQKDYVTATLASAVEKPVHVHNTPDEGFWYVIERAPKPEMQEYIDCLLMMPESTGPTDIPLGIDVNHRLRHAELCKMPHLLVAGTTGYGKSVFLHNLICTLIQRARPDQVQITLVDLAGGVELGVYRNVPHLWGKVVEVETVGGDDLDLFTGDDVE
ncbi:MAG: hypothetical protein JXA33_10925, partial [Anaerolineae bacterium]|nr:hypothetical protein [Anaerolineae bacterium]